MKSIYETFTDEEHAMLKERKGSLTWREFILNLAKKGGVENNGKQKNKLF